jgi:hypothetical protein
MAMGGYHIIPLMLSLPSLPTNIYVCVIMFLCVCLRVSVFIVLSCHCVRMCACARACLWCSEVLSSCCLTSLLCYAHLEDQMLFSKLYDASRNTYMHFCKHSTA